MKISKKAAIRIVFAALALLIIAAAVWRLTPQRFYKISGIDPSFAEKVYCIATFSEVKPGDLSIDAYKMEAVLPHDERLSKIAEIVLSSDYRRDFRNLLPWEITSVSGKEKGEGSASVKFIYGEEACVFQFLDSDTAVLSRGFEEELMIFHPTDKSVFYTLREYIKENGELS